MNDLTRDNDRQLFMVSKCLTNSGMSRQVVELVRIAGSGQIYRNQGGGGGFNSGNVNQ